MKKLFSIILMFTMVLGIAGCGNAQSSNTQKAENQAVEDQSNGTDESKVSDKSNDKKILVAYFSHSGNTKVIADDIHKSVGGEIFEIKTAVPYPEDYNEVVDKAKEEQDADYRPELQSKVEDMNSYDTVFIGYPDWWGTMPMAVFTFLEQYDLAGKTIIPFCTHEGSGLGRSEDDIKKLCPNSNILEGLAVQGKTVNDAADDVEAWLKKINIKSI